MEIKNRIILLFLNIAIVIGSTTQFSYGGELDSLLNKGLDIKNWSAEKLDSLAEAEINEKPAQTIIYIQEYLASQEEVNYKDTSIMELRRKEAEIYAFLGEYELAFEVLKELETKAKQHWGQYTRGILLSDIAEVYYSFRDFQQCLDYSNRSLEIFENIKDSAEIVRVTGNIASVEGEMGNLDVSIKILKELLSVHIENNQQETQSYVATINNLARAFIDLKNYDKAKDLLEQDDIAGVINKELQQGLPILYNLSEVYVALGHLDKALNVTDSAAAIVSKYNLETRENPTLFYKYAAIYKAKGDYQRVFEYKEKIAILLDSTYQVVAKYKLDAYKLLYENQEKQRQLADYESKYQLLEEQKKVNFIIKWAWFLGVLLLIIIVLLIIRNYRLNLRKVTFKVEDVTRKSDYQLDQLEVLALKIIKSQNFLSEVTTEINELKSQVRNTSVKEKMNELFERIKEASALDNDTTDYQTFLDKSIQEFTVRLTKAYPNLNTDEKTICTNIYIGLKNKEIASLMNLSLRSVENKRYRLRKKLGVQSSDSLTNLINRI